jgi:mercuric reductase
MTTGMHDLAIIGGGSAAFSAAITASELGARVAMVERAMLGGTCVNIGCIPSKALLRAAEHHHLAALPRFRGIDTAARSPDWGAMVAAKDELVAAMRTERYDDLVGVYGFEVIPGTARFNGPDEIEVDGRRLGADRYVIATGAAARVPPIEGLTGLDYLTSTSALDLEHVPQDVIVVGASAVGLELGQLFLDLGSEVTFLEALPRIAPFEEPEISAALTAHLETLGARVVTGATITRADRAGPGSRLEAEIQGETIRLEAERVLVATGRRPRTKGLDLAQAGVELDPKGQIRVDDTMATSNPSVYAAGDVTTLPHYVYVAAQSGRIAAENALLRRGRRLDLSAVPRVTFTSPPIASVGLTEAEATATRREPVVSVLRLDVVPRALVDRDTTGLVKLVADGGSGRLVGAHILAEGAGDVIQAAVMGIRYGATVDEIADTFHPYLTMAEALRLAAQGFARDVEHLSCCA